MLKKHRQEARKLLAEITEPSEGGDHARAESKNVLEKLSKMGLLKKNAELDEILALGIEDLLERRLQTLVHRRGLANSTKQARQLIVHGHIAVAGRKITVPSYTVRKYEESKIEYYVGSSIAHLRKSGHAALRERVGEARGSFRGGISRRRSGRCIVQGDNSQ